MPTRGGVAALVVVLGAISNVAFGQTGTATTPLAPQSVMALNRPWIAQKVGLTAEQSQRIAQAVSTFDRINQERWSGRKILLSWDEDNFTDNKNRFDYLLAVHQAKEASETAIDDVLTDEQRDRFRNLPANDFAIPPLSTAVEPFYLRKAATEDLLLNPGLRDSQWNGEEAIRHKKDFELRVSQAFRKAMISLPIPQQQLRDELAHIRSDIPEAKSDSTDASKVSPVGLQPRFVVIEEWNWWNDLIERYRLQQVNGLNVIGTNSRLLIQRDNKPLDLVIWHEEEYVVVDYAFSASGNYLVTAANRFPPRKPDAPPRPLHPKVGFDFAVPQGEIRIWDIRNRKLIAIMRRSLVEHIAIFGDDFILMTYGRFLN